jgi:hypothetical protein
MMIFNLIRFTIYSICLSSSLILKYWISELLIKLSILSSTTAIHKLLHSDFVFLSIYLFLIILHFSLNFWTISFIYPFVLLEILYKNFGCIILNLILLCFDFLIFWFIIYINLASYINSQLIFEMNNEIIIYLYLVFFNILYD